MSELNPTFTHLLIDSIEWSLQYSTPVTTRYALISKPVAMTTNVYVIYGEFCPLSLIDTLHIDIAISKKMCQYVPPCINRKNNIAHKYHEYHKYHKYHEFTIKSSSTSQKHQPSLSRTKYKSLQ